MATKSVGWGKCSIIIKDLDAENAKWIKLPTPKDGTTTLTPTKGDKMTADIEGGGYEDVKYKESTYELAYTIRRALGRKKPMEDKNGVVAHKYAVFVQPENVKVAGPYIPESAVSLEDPFDTTDGGQLTYTHDAITPTTGNTVKWCTIEQDLSTLEEYAELATDPTFTDADSTD